MTAPRADEPGLPSLELVCFGPPTARVDGRDAPREVLWSRHLALLVYLALSPNRTRRRSHLVGLLWPEKPEKDARAALKQSVYRLRHWLGAERLRSSEPDDALTLEGEGLEVDALAFESAAGRDQARAVELLRGDFLEGMGLDEAPAFEDWVMMERQRHRARSAAVLVDYGESQLVACRFTEAGDAARRALALEPHTEPAARLLMRAAVLRRDAGAALAAYREFSESLKTIGESPSRDLVMLSERIRRQRMPAVMPATHEAESPLVGRATEHRDAFAVLAAGLAQGPRTLLVTGAPGMGRTRLLGECVARLTLDGATVAQARPLPSDHDAPFSTLRLLLRAGVHDAAGIVGAHPDALGVLAGLVPSLADRYPPREPRDVAHVATALATVLRAAAEENPVGLALDDAEFADGATLAVLAAAMEQLSNARVVLVVTMAGGGVAAPELLRLRGQIDRLMQGTTVRLKPLVEADVRELVGALAPWCTGDDERDRLARRLTFETGGNPFYAVTLLRGLQRLATLRRDFLAWPRPHATMDTPLPFSVPDLVRTAIAAQVAELDAEGKRVLSAASIGGLAVDLGLVATLVNLPPADVAERLAGPERQHLVEFDGERFVFAAPLIMEVVRGECLTPSQRKALRLRAITALAGCSDWEGRALHAELLAAAEPGRPAFDAAVAVARGALAAGSLRTARRALAAAERAAGAELDLHQSVLSELRAQIGA